MASSDETPVERPKKLADTSAKRRPVEEIALERGLLPMWIESEPVSVNQLGVVRKIQPPPKFNDKHWKFAAAKALRNWPVGAELTDEDFDKAIHEAVNTRIG